MSKLYSDRQSRRRITFFFMLASLGIIVATLLLLGVTLYILMGAGIIYFVSIDISPTLFLLLIMLASVIMGIIITYIVSKFVFRAANQMIDGMQALAEGDFKVRINLGKSPEYRQVSEAFNKLAAELENIQLLRAEFVNEFAHEFKTPIVSIKGFAELLTKDDLTEEQKKEYLNIIIEESKRLSSLAFSSLNFTKIEKQHILTGVTEFNVSEQIRSCILLLENKWTEKNLILNVDFEEYLVKANEDLLKQVWINLIDNAVKFSFVGGTLDVTGTEQDGVLSVTIKNIGAEISQQDCLKIFDKFYRTESAKDIEGSGVGLAIVKKIVELHRGDISVISKDGYTAFKVTLKNVVKIND